MFHVKDLQWLCVSVTNKSILMLPSGGILKNDMKSSPKRSKSPKPTRDFGLKSSAKMPGSKPKVLTFEAPERDDNIHIPPPTQFVSFLYELSNRDEADTVLPHYNMVIRVHRLQQYYKTVNHGIRWTRLQEFSLRTFCQGRSHSCAL